MRNRPAVAQYEATIILVVLSLSLASVVYGGLKRETGLSPQPVFVNTETDIGGTPRLVHVRVNSSSDITITSLSIDGASSTSGIMAFNGSAYTDAGSLCLAGATTFLSIYAREAGTLKVSTDGRAWVSGKWGTEVLVSKGWHEVMIVDGASCTVTTPDGEVLPAKWDSSSPVVSSIPAEGGFSGAWFTVYVPTGGGPHRVLVTTTGGFDDVAL
jgi:hypothetical protein